MFELVFIAALSHTITALPALPATGAVPATAATQTLRDNAIERAAFVDPATIKWRASVEAASVGDFDATADSPFPGRLSGADSSGFSTSDTPAMDGSYDAMLAKRWHWFELYGVSRLHVVPKESRHPWWFSY